MVDPTRPVNRMATRAKVGADPAVSLVGADRVLAVLKELARHPNGVALEVLARTLQSPKPSVHRALAALRRAGLAGQDAPGRYVLGDEFLRLAFAHHEMRPDHVRIRPALDVLAARFGESAHYAVLDGHEVVYRAKVDPPTGAARLTSVVGGRNPAHATAVGKLLLAHHLDNLDAVRCWIGVRRLERRTAHTRVSPEALHRDFVKIRDRGFALDEEESEIGVVCLALPVYLTSAMAPGGAVSVSALAFRTPLAELCGAVDEMRHAIGVVGGHAA